MRVFLDTNVLASAVATRGLCADLFREVLLSHHLIVSHPMLVELDRVLSTKFGVGRESVDGLLRLLHQDTTVATGGAAPDVPLEDESDLVILATAIQGEADVFVTGDKAVQDLRQVCGMKILSPRQFWEELVAPSS